jgi:hypothetical protein
MPTWKYANWPLTVTEFQPRAFDCQYRRSHHFAPYSIYSVFQSTGPVKDVPTNAGFLCDEAYMLGGTIKGTLYKSVLHAFEEKQRVPAARSTVFFWNADSPSVNHGSRSVSRKLHHLTCDFSFKHIIIIILDDSDTVTEQHAYVVQTSLLTKTRWQDVLP